MMVCLPNYEIQSASYTRRMDSHQRKRSTALFLAAVSGSLASFVEGFEKLIFSTMSSQFLSGKEMAFHMYAHTSLLLLVFCMST